MMVSRLPVRPAAPLVAFALVMLMTSPGLAQDDARPPAVTAKAQAQLLSAAPGDYLVRGDRLERTEEGAGAPLFVQADVDRGSGGAMRVTLAIGAEVPRAWAMLAEASAEGVAPSRRAAGSPRLSMSGQPGRIREIKELSVVPGRYQVSVALVHGAGDRLLATVVRHPLVVPAPLPPTLAASPLVLGEAAATAESGPGGEPFRFGPSRLTPALLNRFRQADRLHLAVRLFGWKGDEAARPELTVEYVFQQRIGPHLRFFNKTRPQEVNAATLGKGFDGSSGEVTAGMSVPLGAFPPGAFQVEVRIRDKRTRASTVQTAAFVVTAS